MVKSVMFIDDDESFLQIVERAAKKVETIGDVTKACDGQEAKEYIVKALQNREKLPNLIFVDINMPRMDGFMFLHFFSEMRAKHRELTLVRPIAMLTSSDEVRDREKAKSLGADEYIVKPYGLEILRQLLSDITK